MKHLQILASLIVIFACSFVNGQSALDKGNYQLGGSVNFSWNKDNNDSFHDKAFDINFAPQYSYFIIDNLLVGGLISFNYTEYKWEWPMSHLYVSRNLGIGPIAKYYFRMDGLVPFVGASGVYYKSLGEDEYGLKWNLMAGVDYFIAKSLAVEPFISYSKTNYKKPSSDMSDLKIGIQLNYFVVE